MNKIKDRDARTKKRQKAKNKFDKNITLALDLEDTNRFCTLALNHSEGKVRLLDEGAIVTANGKLDIYIEKGAIKKYAQGKNKKLTPRYLAGDRADEYFENPDEPMNIDEKYEGTINIGHQDFSTFPFIVGTWSQNDLSVADNGDGRKGLDVELKLNEAHPLVQALRVQDIPVGVSVEMYLHEDEKGTAEIQKKVSQDEQYWGMAMAVDEIFIADFAIVGECGNVGSSESVDLQGVTMGIDVNDLKDVEEISLDEIDDIETIDEEPEEEPEETSEEKPVEEAPAEDDEAADDEAEVDEVTDDEEDEGEEVGEATVMERLDALNNKITELVSQNEMLKKQNRKLKSKLQTKIESEKKFFQGLSVSLGIDTSDEPEVTKEKKSVVSEDYATGDGIGV